MPENTVTTSPVEALKDVAAVARYMNILESIADPAELDANAHVLDEGRRVLLSYIATLGESF